MDAVTVLAAVVLAFLLGGYLARKGWPGSPPAPKEVEGTLTVGKGRRVKVGGKSFPTEGTVSDEFENFDLLPGLWTEDGRIISVTIESIVPPNPPVVTVELGRPALRAFHVDAVLDEKVLVYGSYTKSRTRAVKTKCVQCKEGVIVCGIDPHCR